ncbi:MAG: DUF1631 family protein [Candidatus Thiodiazotropha sp.]
MNRRRHPRLDTDIPAVIRYQGQDYDTCRILNFSRGGAYLLCRDDGLKAHLPDGYSTEHERREALLIVPGESLQVKVSVVYFHNDGLGLAFRDADGAQLFKTLYARLQARGEGRTSAAPALAIDPAASQKLLQQVEARTSRFLEHLLSVFFAKADQALQEQIKETSDPQEESALFYTLNSLEQDRQPLTRSFLELYAQGFAELLGETQESANKEADGSEESEELALVEKQEIDTWILINEAARQVEADVSRVLYQLEIALSYLCQGNIHNELDPLSPISLLTNLKSVLDAYELDVDTIRVVVMVFRKILLRELNPFYAELLQLLRKQGLGKLDDQLHDQWNIVTSPESPVHGDGPTSHLTALANLHAAPEQSELDDGMPTADQQAVLASLSSLSQLQGASLQQQIEKLLLQETAQPLKLSPEARSAIGAGEELVAELSRDPLITAELRALLGSLKFLIIEAVLNDTSLLVNPEHAVQRLIDAIEALKPYVNTGPHASLIRDRDSQRLAAITEAVESGHIEHVDQVTQEVRSLQQEQRERFEKNRRLAISRCLMDEKLRQAQSRTCKTLTELLLDRRIPAAIDSLLRFGWVNLLVQCAVLEGGQGKGWQAYLQVVEQLLGLPAGDSACDQFDDDMRQSLLSLIQKGFSEYPVHPEGARQFEHSLHQALVAKDVAECKLLSATIEADAAYLQPFFRDMGLPGEQAPVTADPEWRQCVENLALDTWLLEKSEEGELRVLSLAWKNPMTHRYLLVNGDGFKVFDEELQHLTARFADGRITPMKQPAQPVLERTIETILSNSYDGFRQESSLDTLTGLSNRRAFEAELRKRLNELASGEVPHTLLLIDLDKFQIVNDLCGFEGGDSLLQTVTDILLSYLPAGGFLARIGDDEFSLLLRDRDLEQGYGTAEALRLAIDDYDFEWQGRMIPSSASVGIVQFESNEQTPGELLQAALAACNMAKQGGGNCSRIYLANDSVYQDQQQLVRSLPALKEALARGRMELFVQPIVPLRQAEGLSLHHEILLRIRNHAGELEAPQDFIRAAEQFDMMRAVDRWVVEAFFAQVEPYADKLPPEHSFAINISGKSIGDGEFKRFLMQRIEGSRLKTKHLGFEITETALVGDLSETAAFIEEIREKGCSFSLDDFGSGYASFSYLKDFPVDFVKIDGIFVREILNKPADYAMINSITEIAHFMDKHVIAEYVSDAGICKALMKIGVDYGQGYHFSKPRPLKEVLSEITE